MKERKAAKEFEAAILLLPSYRDVLHAGGGAVADPELCILRWTGGTWTGGTLFTNVTKHQIGQNDAKKYLLKSGC